MAAITRARVSGLTKRVPFTTWDTVETETPAAFATSVIVTIASLRQCAREMPIVPGGMLRIRDPGHHRPAPHKITP
ncbi:hypothetical protein HPA02_28550 [Bisbaumannia pacifica]|uniref:Uncharacterized protein n=1 Tax=Bisbaumannia pacifica TaxID=77098 RepID=A0A510XAX0_9GAMM|nr:hypothetical protein HPA02_28550 [Halomonas pacifica]